MGSTPGVERPQHSRSCLQGFQLDQLQQPGVYKPFGIGVALMALQQLSGINAVMFYAETIFEEAKFKVEMAGPAPPPPPGAWGRSLR